MNRGLIRLFKYIGLLGCGLSATGLVLNVVIVITNVFKRDLQGLTTFDQALRILGALIIPGIPLLLSGLLSVAYEIALQLPRTAPDRDPDHD